MESGCGQMEKVSSAEDVTNSDSSPVDNVSDEDSGKPFASHPMELSCIVETDNETSLGNDFSNNVGGVELGILPDNLREAELDLDGKSIDKLVHQKGLARESNVSGLNACDSNVKNSNLPTASAALIPIVEEIDAKDISEVIVLSSEDLPHADAARDPSPKRVSKNEEVSDLQNADPSEKAISNLGVGDDKECLFEVNKSGSPFPLLRAMKERAEESKTPDDNANSALREQATNSSATLMSSSSSSRQVNATLLDRGVSSSQNLPTEASRAEKVGSGVFPSASSLPIIKSNGGGTLKGSEVNENCLATDFKEDASNNDRIAGGEFSFSKLLLNKLLNKLRFQ